MKIRPVPQRTLIAVAFVLLGVTASCGGVSQEDSAQSNGPTEPAVSTKPDSEEVDQSPSDFALWTSFAQLAEGAEESESYPTLEEMARTADAAVVGTIKSIRLGRQVSSGGSVPALPFAEFLIEPSDTLTSEPQTQADGTILLEVPFMATSPELEAAIDAAIDREAASKATTDEELAAATDDEKIQAAYDQFYSDAVEQTVARMNATRPTATSLFLLRKQPAEIKDLPIGAYRLINGSALIVDSAGSVALPLRAQPQDDPIGKAIVGEPFEQVIRDTESAR